MNKAEEFRKIMETSNTDKVIILTNHYQIVGRVYDFEDCNKENFLTLTNASLCLINDVYDGQTCDKYTSSHYDWLNVNIKKIVAFSFTQ